MRQASGPRGQPAPPRQDLQQLQQLDPPKIGRDGLLADHLENPDFTETLAHEARENAASLQEVAALSSICDRSKAVLSKGQALLDLSTSIDAAEILSL